LSKGKYHETSCDADHENINVREDVASRRNELPVALSESGCHAAVGVRKTDTLWVEIRARGARFARLAV
jgi:hypothetical protein